MNLWKVRSGSPLKPIAIETGPDYPAKVLLNWETRNRTHVWKRWQFVYQTSPFTILESQNPWIDELYVVQECRSTDFKAPKLWKGSSGNSAIYYDVILFLCNLYFNCFANVWPDQIFHSFRFWKNPDQRILCSTNTILRPWIRKMNGRDVLRVHGCRSSLVSCAIRDINSSQLAWKAAWWSEILFPGSHTRSIAFPKVEVSSFAWHRNLICPKPSLVKKYSICCVENEPKG